MLDAVIRDMKEEAVHEEMGGGGVEGTGEAGHEEVVLQLPLSHLMGLVVKVRY